MGSEFNPDMIKVLKKKVFSAAREGMAISIFAMLWNLDRCVIKEVLDYQTEEDGQTTTPLIIAARNGEEKVIQVLLSNFSVDIEQTGTVKFDGYVIEGATALWCASGAGHFNVVKCLIEHGADVNHPTLTNSTPLRAACFDGRLDIVRYLVEHKSDLTIANKYNNTCLMISCYKGHRDVVAYLLEKGASPDCRAHCGATALHFSAECGHLSIVRLLVKFGASMPKNDHFMTPLIVAAECGKADVVEYICSLNECSKVDKINALELLGATFANDKENYDINRAYYYLKKGMEERFKNSKHVVHKQYYPPVPAYGNRRESQSLAELELLEKDNNALHMESLAIRERILGPDTPEVPHPVIFRGAVFADSARFERCISLWMHAMKLRQRNNRTISKDLLRFSQVFSQMVHLGVKLQFLHVENVFEHAVVELERDRERIALDEEDKDALNETYQANIHTCLYLLVIALRIEKNKEEVLQLNKLMYKFLQIKPVLKNGYSPLHMVCDGATLVDDFHVNDVVSFPCASLAVALVKCGADINFRDTHGNIPLHVIVRYTNPINGFDTLHQIILSLIMAGSHLDIRNYERKVPVQCCTTGVAEVILRQHSHISLKCIAARCIRDNNIQYRSLLPMFLEEFIHLH
ncbi:protein fem-1 homolog B-like [Gigantopelta aegis]|uniref:protein fem-1 homolog B-like n=1 Tax=Gigantopelta aegis TaxID=1735272 RepID=UPI001B88E1DA|nr:protein fem-1 homolog B-like [Gigantopelta aegis]